MNHKLLIIVLVFFLSLTFTPLARAQEKGGITVSPSIIHLDLATDPPEYQLTYTNNTSSEINLLLNVTDFTELEDSYKINFLEGKDAQNYKYSLSSWISFENKTIQLSPNEKKTVKVFIDKNRITKGGHYASILAEIVQPEIKDQVNVKAILSSLLFVRASTGQEIEDGKISSFNPVRDGIEFPTEYSVSFMNKGNVHVIPYGLISIFDPLGNLVAKGAFNENSLDALPETIRHYSTKVITYQKVLLPGIYTARVDLHFGKSEQKVSSTVKFFSQGMFDFVKITLLIVAVAVGLIIFYKKRKKFNS